MKTDEDLARAFAAGDNLAFALLYSRYKQPIYVFALRMLRQPEKARDAFQAAFLKTFECRPELARVIRFRSWIFTVVRNFCLNKNDFVCSIHVWKDEASVAQAIPLGDADAASRIASFSNVGYGGAECYKTYSNGEVLSSSSGCQP
jgi:DNA-directed RNA polymerase specialized sigma24 family protein